MPTNSRPQQRSNSIKQDRFSFALLAYTGNAGQARAHLVDRTKTQCPGLRSRSSTNVCSCRGRLPSRCRKESEERKELQRLASVLRPFSLGFTQKKSTCLREIRHLRFGSLALVEPRARAAPRPLGQTMQAEFCCWYVRKHVTRSNVRQSRLALNEVQPLD